MNDRRVPVLFNYMVRRSIPALQPTSFEVEVILLRAGVKIANPGEVAP